MASKTIAYSTDGDYWKTRYDFIPSCYAYVDNRMITCINASSSQAWYHDPDAPKCNYYGKQSIVTMTVASNKEPSRNKTFQNLSLETTLPKWNAILATFPDSNVVNEAQFSYIDSERFVTKEGARYTDIPRGGKTNKFDLGSTVNIVFLGRKQTYNTSGNIVFLNDLSQASTAINKEAVIIGYDGTTAYCIVNGQVAVYNGQENALRLKNDLDADLTIAGELPVEGDATPAIFDPIFDNIFVAYPSSIDGDSLRGRTCILTLESESSVENDFELYAINVDYEYSGLDT